MSERNGDRARFQKDRKRKLRHRQRIAALLAGLRNAERVPGAANGTGKATRADVASSAESLVIHDEGAPLRKSD